MNAKLGDTNLHTETIEGYVASTVYGKSEGDSVFRRITPIASILVWAGVCENEPNGLRLTEMAFEDERIIRQHWNYFISLERDLDDLSRCIEFDVKNFETFSTKLALILLSSSSEVDVVAKELCKEIDNTSKAEGIIQYRKLIEGKYPEIMEETVYLLRYNLKFEPWKDWSEKEGPFWWRAYNKVKHERGVHYEKANLENVLNALAGLLVIIVYLRKAQIKNRESLFTESEFAILKPLPSLLKLKSEYYTFISGKE